MDKPRAIRNDSDTLTNDVEPTPKKRLKPWIAPRLEKSDLHSIGHGQYADTDDGTSPLGRSVYPGSVNDPHS